MSETVGLAGRRSATTADCVRHPTQAARSDLAKRRAQEIKERFQSRLKMFQQQVGMGESDGCGSSRVK